VQSCSIACDFTRLFSKVICVVRTVRKFHLRLVINEERTTSCSDIDSGFWQNAYVFLRNSSRVLRNSSTLSGPTAFSWVSAIVKLTFHFSERRLQTQWNRVLFEQKCLVHARNFPSGTEIDDVRVISILIHTLNKNGLLHILALTIFSHSTCKSST
jgi:hypothetical protein